MVPARWRKLILDKLTQIAPKSAETLQEAIPAKPENLHGQLAANLPSTHKCPTMESFPCKPAESLHGKFAEIFPSNFTESLHSKLPESLYSKLAENLLQNFRES